jgi:hypothetical protein
MRLGISEYQSYHQMTLVSILKKKMEKKGEKKKTAPLHSIADVIPATAVEQTVACSSWVGKT